MRKGLAVLAVLALRLGLGLGVAAMHAIAPGQEGQHQNRQADADSRPVNDVVMVEVRSDPSISHRILFDPGHGLEERLIVEQFA